MDGLLLEGVDVVLGLKVLSRTVGPDLLKVYSILGENYGKLLLGFFTWVWVGISPKNL